MSRKQKRGGSTTERPAETGGQGRGRAGERRGRDRSRRRNDRGQYVEQMTESEILALLDRIPGPVIATTDVAEHFDSTTEGARRKLNDLCDAGVLDRRKVGGTRVYWRAETEGTS
ncbi:MAG: hypothetical protein ACQEQJ_07505 [Halobacteriota archaeon]